MPAVRFIVAFVGHRSITVRLRSGRGSPDVGVVCGNATGRVHVVNRFALMIAFASHRPQR
jgi:hypothetical protein